MSMIYGGSNVTFPDGTTQNTAPSGMGFKNRLINGSMLIDQRNAGASVTPTNGQYLLDRWQANLTQASKFSVQQIASALSGFSASLKVTSLSAYSIGSGDVFAIRQIIEGYNVADLGWGTANAATVTLSFKVNSSLTGTFGGSIQNYASNRSYPFTYSVSAANTWTTVSVTIPGDTSGTWATDNSGGIQVFFGLGVGSTYSGTASAWAGADYRSATSTTSVVGTNGATFYITGVQLEKGSTATSFDYRPYGTELALCQRYYETNTPVGTAPSNTYTYPTRLVMSAYNGSTCSNNINFCVEKRASPTLTYYGGNVSGTSNWSVYIGGTWYTMTSMALSYADSCSFDTDATRSGSFSASASHIAQGGWAASAEL